MIFNQLLYTFHYINLTNNMIDKDKLNIVNKMIGISCFRNDGN